MMKKLIVNNEVFKAEKIIKTKNDIIGYIKNEEVFAFRGINDFSVFKLENGEFDIPEKKLQQEMNSKLLKDIANLEIELNKQKELNATLLIQIAKTGGI